MRNLEGGHEPMESLLLDIDFRSGSSSSAVYTRRTLSSPATRGEGETQHVSD